MIHREGRILVQGYNGAPAGLPHCDHNCTCGAGNDAPSLQHTVPCNSMPEGCRAVHAEQNGIAWAARVGVKIEGSEIFCTHQPCLSCARSLINAGVEKVFFWQDYRLKDGLDLLIEARIAVERLVDYSPPVMIG